MVEREKHQFWLSRMPRNGPMFDEMYLRIESLSPIDPITRYKNRGGGKGKRCIHQQQDFEYVQVEFAFSGFLCCRSC